MPADKNFWKHVDETAKIVEKWPKWKRGGEGEGKMNCDCEHEGGHDSQCAKLWHERLKLAQIYSMKEIESLRQENLALALQNKEKDGALLAVLAWAKKWDKKGVRLNNVMLPIEIHKALSPDLATEIVKKFRKGVEAEAFKNGFQAGLRESKSGISQV